MLLFYYLNPICFYQPLSSSTGFYLLLPAITGFYLLLPTITGYYRKKAD